MPPTRDRRLRIGTIAAAVVLLCCGAVPVVLLLGASLFSEEGSLSFSRYGDVLATPVARRLLMRSTYLALISTFVACALGVPYGALIGRWAVPGRRIFLALAALPILIPAHVHTMAWLNCLASSQAVTGILQEARGVGWGALLAGAVQGFWLTPLAVLFAAAAFAGLDRDQEDAARLDGGAWQVFRSVTLPTVLPGATCGALAVFCVSLVGYEVPWILGVNTYASDIYSRLQTGMNPADAAAAALPLIAVVAVLGALGWAWLRTRGDLSPAAGDPTALRPLRGAPRAGALAFLTGVLLLAAAVPLASLLAAAGLKGSVFRDALVNEGPSLIRSVALALAVATVALILCWPAGHRLARSGGAWGWLWPATLLPLAAPPFLLATGLIWIVNRPGPLGWLYTTPLILVIGGMGRFAPVCLLAATGAAARVPRELEEAAAIDGATPGQTYRHVVLPLTAASAGAAAVALFALMVGEVGVSFPLQVAGWRTYPIAFMNLVHVGYADQVSGLALVQLAVCAAPVLAGAALILRSWR